MKIYSIVYWKLFLNERKIFKKLSQHQREGQGKNNNDTLDLLLPINLLF